jgi:hypothetical protein
MATRNKPIESRGSIMETDKKPSALSTQLFDMTKSFSNMSRTGSLYGRLNMIKDMQIYLAQEEIKVKKEIEENESNV